LQIRKAQTWRNDTSITALNVYAVKWEILLAQVIASFALVNVHASISSRVSFETRETLAVECSKSVSAGGLTSTNKRILSTLVDVTALNKFAGEDDGVESSLTLADERTVGVLAACSNRWTIAIDSALVNVFAIGCVHDTLVSLNTLAGERPVVVKAVFKV